MSVVGPGLSQAANIKMRACAALSLPIARSFTGSRTSNHISNKMYRPGGLAPFGRSCSFSTKIHAVDWVSQA